MTIEDALIFAAQKHRGQRDKGGHSYIFHPIRVMQNLGAQASEEAKMAALLHDVVEDGGVTLGELRKLGCPEAVVEAVDHLTKDEEGRRDYEAAIRRAARNPIARQVKMADLTDNLDESRIPNPTNDDRRRVEKYRKALRWLQSHAEASA